MSATEPAYDENSTYSDLRTDDNQISVDLITGYVYNKIKKTFQSSFNEVYNDLLERISDDYAIDLDELKERYPLKVNVRKRKVLNPAEACISSTKKGTPCPNPRKDGTEYCGVHLRSLQQQEGGGGTSYEDRGKTPATPTKTPVAAGSYVPKEERKKKAAQKKPVAKAVREKEPEPEEPAEEEPAEEEPAEEEAEEEEHQVEAEIETIEGTDYIVCGSKIYELPDDFDDGTSLEELTQVGEKTGSGEVEWLNQDD